jgi:hypothetical protein
MKGSEVQSSEAFFALTVLVNPVLEILFSFLDLLIAI